MRFLPLLSMVAEKCREGAALDTAEDPALVALGATEETDLVFALRSSAEEADRNCVDWSPACGGVRSEAWKMRRTGLLIMMAGISNAYTMNMCENECEGRTVLSCFIQGPADACGDRGDGRG